MTKDNWEIRRLRADDDIYTIAELLMETDPFIYKDLFGSYENAVKVLPCLFRRDSGIFKRSCYYLALDNKDILGMIAIFKYGDDWQEEEVRMAFIEAGVALPQSFNAVSKYFKEAHNYQPEVKACNVCVRKEYRRRGVGDFMVKEVIRMAGNSNIMLTVLTSNETAVKLYRDNGFRILYEYDDYGGYGNGKVRCYSMIRLHTVKNIKIDS